MHSDFHAIDLELTVPDGLIEVGGQPFSYRPLRQYLESLGWRDVFVEAGRSVGVVPASIDIETLHERIQSFLMPADSFEFLDTSGIESPTGGAESQWFERHFPERLP